MIPTISIIVPIFNVESYIEDCIESIKAQSYPYIEVVFVDDCGSDKSMEIVRRYLSRTLFPQSQIVKHDCNRGLSAARNTGMKHAKGEYVYFLDSDDTVTPDAIALLVEPLAEKSYDFVVGEYSVVGSDHIYPQITVEGDNLSGDNILQSYCRGEWYMMAWNKLCNRDFLIRNNLWFEEGILHEDVVWSFKLACLADSMSIVREATYVYKIRSNSIMTATAIQKDAYNYVNVFEHISDFITKNNYNGNADVYSLFEGRRSTLLFSLLSHDEYTLFSECYDALKRKVYVNPFEAYRKKIIGIKYLVRDLHYNMPSTLGKLYKRIFYNLAYKMPKKDIEGALF